MKDHQVALRSDHDIIRYDAFYEINNILKHS